MDSKWCTEASMFRRRRSIYGPAWGLGTVAQVNVKHDLRHPGNGWRPTELSSLLLHSRRWHYTPGQSVVQVAKLNSRKAGWEGPQGQPSAWLASSPPWSLLCSPPCLSLTSHSWNYEARQAQVGPLWWSQHIRSLEESTNHVGYHLIMSIHRIAKETVTCVNIRLIHTFYPK